MGPAAALLVGYVSIQIRALYRQSGSDRSDDGQTRELKQR